MKDQVSRSAEWQLIDYVMAARFEQLPKDVVEEAVRSFVNWVGCAIGGSRHRMVAMAEEALMGCSGSPEATLIGLKKKTDILTASLINCVSSGAYAFDDTHAEMVLHPVGPIASTLMALAERKPISGTDFLLALVLGVEVECRLTKAISFAPADCNVGWYLTGLTGGMGAAAAAAKVMKLDADQTMHAVGIASGEGSGFRALHGSMCSPLIPAHAGQTGLRSALFASRGFTSTHHFLTGSRGFLELFSNKSNVSAITEGLGQQHEILLNTYKPYPCGIVIHAAIDAALRLRRERNIRAEQIESVVARVHPVAVTLADLRHPIDDLQSKVSVQHWVAASFVDGQAGIQQLSRVSIPAIAALREKISVSADPAIEADEAEVSVKLTSGETVTEHVRHCIGSQANPMRAPDLEVKFRELAVDVIDSRKADAILEKCWRVQHLANVGEIAGDAA